MIRYIFGAGAVAGLFIGYRLGHMVGAKTPQRKIHDATEAFKAATDRVAHTISKAKERVLNR